MPDPEPMATLPTRSEASPEEIERQWREQVYRGDHVPQLTARALLTGAALGVLTGLSNLYVGLKVGWGLGVVITASILGWATWRVLGRVWPRGRAPTILEANAMASTASAAGYSTGTILASAIAAYLLLAGDYLPLWQLILWVLLVSVLGLFVAVPLKRSLINTEQLAFPTGAAAAETLRSLHAEGSGGARRARALVLAMGAGLLLKLATAVLPLLLAWTGGPSGVGLPASLPTAGMLRALPWLAAAAAYGWVLPVSLLLPAAGVLIGWRTAWSILLGAVVCFGLLAPTLHDAAIIAGPGYREVVVWSVWPGATMMVVAGLVGLGFQWRSVARSLGGLVTGLGRGRRGDDPMAALEVPGRWLAWGGGGAALGCVVMQVVLFDIPVGVAGLAVLLAVLLAVVAARVAGETDVTPTGPLGKVAQLAGGVVLPGRPLPNLMMASVAAGAAASAADLLTDLKSGHLLGAHPRRQFLAQLTGVVVGALVLVPVFRYVLVPRVEALGGEQWPAPAARIWVSVSQLVAQGLGSIHPTAIHALWISALLALVLACLERLRPRWRPWLPSATGLGLAFVLPAANAVSFFVGGIFAWRVARRRADAVSDMVVPVASGLIAGESLMGIVAAVLTSHGG